MTDLNVALILRMIDQFSGPADKVRAAIRGMGNSAKEFRQGFAAQIRAGFSEANIADALAKNEQAVNKARGRLMGAFGMGLTLAAPVMASAKMESSLISYGNLASLTGEKVRALGADLGALSRRDQTGMSSGQLLSGLETYVGKGLDQDAALKALLATGRAAKATRSEFDLMAASGFAVMDNRDVKPEQLRKVFDVMAQGGKDGGFELRDMAKAFPEITAGAKALGMEGVDGVASLTALLQIATKSAGSTDQAANNFSNFLGKLASPDTVKNFSKFGVDVQAELNKAAASGADPLEHMLGVIQKVTGGDQFKMGELFADKQVLDFLRAAIPNLEEYRRIKAKALGADGVVDKDFAAEMQGLEENVTQLKNSLIELNSASGALLPALTDITKQATSFIYAVTDWTKANPELTAGIVKWGAAALAGGVALRVLGYGFALMGGPLIRVVSWFLKFNDAGRNVSIAAKAVRGLFSVFGGLAKLGKFSLSALIAPLRWTAGLIPRIPWAVLTGGKFALRSRVAPLRWTAGLIGRIPWATLTGGKFALRSLVAPLRWTAGLIPRIPWAVLTGGKFALSGMVAALSWAKLIPQLAWSKFVRPILLKDFGPGITQVGSSMATAAAQTEAASARMNKAISGIRFSAVMNGIQAFMLLRDLDSSAPDPKAEPEAFNAWQQGNAKGLEDKIRATPGLKQLTDLGDWTAGLHDRLFGKPAAPALGNPAGFTKPDFTSPNMMLPIGGASTPTMRSAAENWMATPRIETRGGTGPAAAHMATPPAAAPVQSIEETIKHDYRSEQSITVTVPVQITQQVAADAARISRDVGARVEAATRRALSDHGGPQ